MWADTHETVRAMLVTVSAYTVESSAPTFLQQLTAGSLIYYI